jgi:NTP pyrophosphatase (non-canonical NTP hydrolase)
MRLRAHFSEYKMELKEYPGFAMRTAKKFPDLQWNLLHALMGINSEVGELQETIARAWMQLPFDPVNISEEGGDISWYVALLATTLDWDFDTLFLQPDALSEHEAMAIAVINRNPPAMSLVLGGIAGDIGTIIKAHLIYGKPFDADALKLRTSYLISLVSLLMDVHGIDYLNSCLPENIAKLKKRYPEQYSDVAAMERADKPRIATNETQH